MASADDSGDLQTEDPEDDLEPSRFLPDDGKRAGWLSRIKQNRFFVIFIVGSVIFHAGFIWMLQSFDLSSVMVQLKVLEIPVELMSEGQAQKSHSGQAGSEAKTASPPSQDQGQAGGSEKDTKAKTAKPDASSDKPAETKTEKPAEPPAKPAEEKPAETKPAAKKAEEPDQKPQPPKEAAQKPSASAPEKPAEQKPQASLPEQAPQSQPASTSAPQAAREQQTSRVASPQNKLPMFYQPSDRLSLAIPAPLPMDDADAEPVSYKLIVFGMLERAKEFPESARERHAMGHVVVSFSIDDRGQPQNVAVVRPSGEADLDAESLAMIDRAAPFPVPPAGAQRDFAVDIGFGGQ